MNNTKDWYKELKKPKWAPPESLFGQVWAFLYIIIVIVNIYVLYGYLNNEISLLIALPFWANLFFNFIFTPIQFGLKNNLLAFLDILLILFTIILAMAIIWPISNIMSLLFIPYLIWVCIATVLQASITYLNYKVVK
jgi:tryptophan-rich sensory protein